MKIKNLSFVEKHIEKIVLAVCVLIAGLVTWSFVLQMPYGVKIGSSDELVAPDVVDEKLIDVVKKLETAINNPESPLPPMPVPSYTRGFRDRVMRGLANIPEYDSPIGPPGLDPSVFESKPLPPPEYIIRTPPKPEKLLVRSDFSVLARGTDEKVNETLSRMIGRQDPPFDFYYASVAANFPMDQWRTLLKTAPEANRIPEEMWRGALLIVDVKLQRQTWDQANQRWAEETLIDPLPGRMSFRSPPQSFTHQEASDMVDTVRAQQEMIARAPFPQVSAERPWVAPEAKEDRAAPESSHTKATRLLNSQIDNLQKQITRLEAEVAKPAPTPGATPPAPGAPPIPGAPPAAAPPAPRPAPAAKPKGESELERARAQLKELLAERDKLEGSKAAARPPVPGGEGMGTAVRGEVHAEPIATASLDTIKILAHDITVKPGNKYRYRLIASVLNPLFQKPRLAGDQKKMYFHKLSLDSEVSDWTPDVVIPKPNRYFLVSADEGNQTITMEVWSIFNGAWRPQEFVVRPGDFIGRKIKMAATDKKFEADVDLRMGVLVVDADFKAVTYKGGLSDKTTRAIFLDPATNKLHSRSLEEDLNSPERAALRNAGTPVAEVR